MTCNLKIGLVNIPVMTFNTINRQENSIHFSEAHIGCGGCCGRKKYCKGCEKELSNDEIGKKYGDRILARDEIEKVKEFLENNQIEIVGFSKIDINAKKRFFYGSYNLVADISSKAKKTNQKSYFAFVKALQNKGLSGIAVYTSRGTQHLGLVYVDVDDSLIMSLLPFNEAINKDIERIEENTPKFKDVELPIKDCERFIEQNITKKTLADIKNTLKERFEEYLKGNEEIEITIAKVKEEDNPFKIAIKNKARR